MTTERRSPLSWLKRHWRSTTVLVVLAGLVLWWVDPLPPYGEPPYGPRIPTSAAGGLITDITSPQDGLPGALPLSGMSADGTVLAYYAEDRKDWAPPLYGEHPDGVDLRLVRRDGTYDVVATADDPLMDFTFGSSAAFGDTVAVLTPAFRDERANELDRWDYTFVDLATGEYTSVTPTITDGVGMGDTVHPSDVAEVVGDTALTKVGYNGGFTVVAATKDGRSWFPLDPELDLGEMLLGTDACTGKAWIGGMTYENPRDRANRGAATFTSYLFDVGEPGSRSTLEAKIELRSAEPEGLLAASPQMDRCGDAVVGELYPPDGVNPTQYGYLAPGGNSFEPLDVPYDSSGYLSLTTPWLAYGKYQHSTIVNVETGQVVVDAALDGVCGDTQVAGDLVRWVALQKSRRGDPELRVTGRGCATFIGRIAATD